MAGRAARLLALTWLSAIWLRAGLVQAAEPLVADLSSHLVAITTGFSGSDVLLFGAVEEGPGEEGAGGTDVVVVVRGPERRETVRRKDRFGAVWINSGTAEAAGVPSYYQVAATRPLDQLAAPAALARHRIGVGNLRFDIPGDEHGKWRDAVVRLKQRQGLYGTEVGEVGFLGRRLFRTDLHFPANVPVGTYTVDVYLVAGGEVVSSHSTPLVVSKIGLGANLSDFAHGQALAYGVVAVLVAAAGGWLAAAAVGRS